MDAGNHVVSLYFKITSVYERIIIMWPQTRVCEIAHQSPLNLPVCQLSLQHKHNPDVVHWIRL